MHIREPGAKSGAMHTADLMEGLELFVIGVGGVFVNLFLVYAAISLTGWLIRRRERTEQSEQPEGLQGGAGEG
jgi:Na+-transporting methylmalonyl-CoA/oxaloacetate decarboxylase gamma subunit